MMDFNISHKGIGCAKCVLDVTLTQEVSQELVIPDSMPDVMNTADTDAVAYLKSKDADGGKAMAGGVLSCTVVYVAENSGEVKRVSCEIPFSVSAQGDEVNTQSRIIAYASVSQTDAVIVNSRKLIIKAEIVVTMKCYNDTAVQICSGIESPEAAELHVLPKEESFLTAVSVREKTFVISSELALKGSNPPIGELIKAKSRVFADDVKAVGNKIIVRGRSVTEIVYRAAGSPLLLSESHSEDYSQIVEMDTPAEGGTFEVYPMLTGAFYDTDMMTENGEGMSVACELHVVLQCAAFTKVQISYIADAYSTKFDVNAARESASMNSSEKSFMLTGNYKDVVEVSPKPSKILFSSLFQGQIVRSYEGNIIVFASRQYIRIVYADESGNINSYLHRMDISSSCECEEGLFYEAEHFYSEDLSISAASGVAEIRLNCSFAVTAYKKREVEMISKISLSDEEKSDMSELPSVIIHTVLDGETVWELAKKFNTTTEMILGLNEIELSDLISAKKLLIVPKKR